MGRAGKASQMDQSLLRKGAAGVVALALGLTLAGAASAADLYPNNHRPQAGSPYDDPRYAELYGSKDDYDDKRRYRKQRRYEPRSKHNGYDDTESYRDKDYARPRERDHAYNNGYADRGYRDDRRGYRDDRRGYDGRKHYRKDYGLGEHCIPRGQVLRRLRHQGWYNFTDLELRGQKATVRADNRDGGHYHLVIQRCSGEVLWADRIDRRYRRSGGWRSAYGPSGYR
ncbi:MAG: hypothetical protein ACR2OV_05640 [Hyphomicrobiaceae bacterium]